MNTLIIRPAKKQDANLLVDMLKHLANELGMGDTFSSTSDIIRNQGFGVKPLFYAMIGEIDGLPIGFILYFPYFSTTLGLAGTYIQDLWVDTSKRNEGVGEKLLARAINDASEQWGAAFLKLSVHSHNAGAIRFYTKLGFQTGADEKYLDLRGNQFSMLQGA